MCTVRILLTADMHVEIWSDVVCPWCYVGKRRFEAALAEFAHRESVEVHWRSFELDTTATSAVPGDGDSYADRLGRKYGLPTAESHRMLDGMTETGASVGLRFDFTAAVPANTFDAHQLLHLAAEHGLQSQVKERLLAAHFTQGRPVGDRATLVELGAESGLPGDLVHTALSDQRYAAAVRADQAAAADLGISGVPFFVIDARYGVSGAQPSDLLLRALTQAWEESTEQVPVVVPGTSDTEPVEVCGPDGCPI